MSIRNILVSFNGSEPAGRAVRLAVAVARRYDAHLTGIFAHTVPQSYIQMEAYLTQAALEIMAESASDAEEQVTADFNDIIAAEEQGLRTSFICERGFPNDVLVRFGRTYDLIVVAQPDGSANQYDEGDPDLIALRSGRPVLIAPRTFTRLDLASGAVVAWDGERAAARALADSIDLLEDKDNVTVLHVGQEADVRKPGRDVMEHLSRHDVNAELRIVPPGGASVADKVLDACAETKTGLLIMGAYEHSYFSEKLFGGVTHDVLARTPIPVLMAH